ncbi:sigma-70 family RNA polymerase sigma factor [Alkalihalobacillus clausii]|uniref:sigma-70 family RNA polymerase sigma factor n=1 Tax=Shouchella clausii TaxID=79880 RepID=UPI001C23F83C|nr:sigma-70 family RNA polymerase sigma factor [Shouchella clausii]MBU8598474.1 sigma-70 family RNA polymerase sigma factor [Shouchella clausii]
MTTCASTTRKFIEGEWLDREQAFEKYERFARMAASKRLRQAKTYDLEPDEVYNIAAIGFLKAYDTFDTNKGASFPTRAYQYAHYEILKSFRDTNLRVHIPRTTKELMQKIKKVPSYRDKTAEELSSELNEDLGEVEWALHCLQIRTVSLNKRTHHDEAGNKTVELYELMLSDEADHSIAIVNDFMRRLSGSDRLILRLAMQDKKQQDIADIIGCSQVQISRRLRQHIAKEWADYAGV